MGSDSGGCLSDCKHGNLKGQCWRCENDKLRRQEIEKDARIAALTEENAKLKSLLAEAHEAVCNWGSYAGEYFQEKWGLQGDIDKFAPFEQFYPKSEPRSPEETQAMIEKYIAQATKKEPR